MIKIGNKRENSGISLIETALTLPVLVTLIFFILEMMRVNNTQTAIDSIATEATFDFIANRNTDNFEAIITKYKPPHLPRANIAWYFAVYADLATMCSTSPYGGEEIYWPNGTSYSSSPTTYLESDNSKVFLARTGDITLSNYCKPELSFSSSKSNDTMKSLRGKAFVLTFVCNHEFSSSIIAKTFAGGYNTNDKTKYLIWSRGVGICN